MNDDSNINWGQQSFQSIIRVAVTHSSKIMNVDFPNITQAKTD